MADEKLLNLNDMLDIPEEDPPAVKPPVNDENIEQKEEEKSTDPDEEEAQEEESTEEETEEEESSVENPEEEKEEESTKPAAKEETETEEEKPPSKEDTEENPESKATEEGHNVDQVIESEFSEYGLESKEDIENVLNDYRVVLEENEELKKRPTEPQFNNDFQKKVFEFITKHDFDNIGSGLESFGKLTSLDVRNLNDETALREKFILDNQDVSREDAVALFESQFEKEYTYKTPEDDEDYSLNEKKLVGIKLRNDAEKARKQLLKKQEEWKPEEVSKEQKSEEEKFNWEPIDNSISSQVKSFEEGFEGFNELTYKFDDNKDNDFHYKFNEKQVNSIKKNVLSVIKNHQLYNDDGSLRAEINFEDQIMYAASALYHKEMMNELYKHATNVNLEQEINLKSKKKPERKAAKSGQNTETMDGAFEALARQKSVQRNKQKPKIVSPFEL